MANTEKNIAHKQHRRLKKILGLLKDRGHVKKAVLAQANECSTRSIQRDIDVLIGDGWPIEQDRNGYYLDPHILNDLETSKDSRIAALVLTGCTIDSHLHANFPELAMNIKSELLDQPDLRTTDFGINDSKVSVQHSNMDDQQLKDFGGLARNILEELPITFDYRSVGDTKGSLRTVFPIRLKQHDGIWYLHGYDIQKEAARVYTVAKITGVSVSSAPFLSPPESLLQKIRDHESFSIWHDPLDSSQETIVKIKLFGHAANFVRTHQVHPSQKLTAVTEQSCILQMKTNDMEGIKLFLFKFTNLVEVISPANLKQDFLADLYQAIERNQ